MSRVMKEVAGVLGIILVQSRTIGLPERCYASIQQALKIETRERGSLWHKYVSIAVIIHNTSNHAIIGFEPSRVYQRRITYIVLDLKMSILLQKFPAPNSPNPQDVLEETDMILQNVRKIVMQAYIKYKAYYDKKNPLAQNLNEQNTFTLYSRKSIAKETKFSLSDFRWIGPYKIANVLPNNNYLVRKIGTNETQVVHRMTLPQFTPRQPIPDYQITLREWKSDLEVIIKHDDLYARAWECEYEKSFLDGNYNNQVTPNSHEISVPSEGAADKTSATPGTRGDSCPEKIPKADKSCGRTDTDHYMDPDADTSVEQPDPTPTNP